MARYSSRIAEVADYLSCRPGTPKEKLVIGGKMLSAALMFSSEWPPALVNKAARLKASLLKGYKVEKAVENLTDNAAKQTLKQLTQDMIDLAQEIERAKSKSRSAK